MTQEEQNKKAQELFEIAKKRSALRFLQIYNALKYRGMDGMKKKIVELI